jgi:hypothetical protein
MRLRFLRWIWPILVILIGNLLFFVWWGGIFKPLPPLLETLPGSWTDAASEFKARIDERFPVGSSEDKLIEVLTGEGFRPDWPHRNDAASASFIHPGLLCNREARVLWRADQLGVLTSVDGRYLVTCERL